MGSVINRAQNFQVSQGGLSMRLNRRKFLQVSAGVATAMALTSKRVGAQLKPVVKVGNPLESYPDRRWEDCLLYTSPSPRDRTRSRMPSSA